MITKDTYNEVSAKTLKFFDKAGIVLTKEEKDTLEVADFGLNDIYNVGLQVITYINTDRVCSKELVLLPNQTCPEHYHPRINDDNIGKEETFRCRFGKVYLYIEGTNTKSDHVKMPNLDFTVFHEIVLNPGEQYTLSPNTKHWFISGGQGAVVSEFSTKSIDERDVYTDKKIDRMPKIGI